MSKKRAKKIKLLLFDVDGVLTDGKILIFPRPPAPDRRLGARRETRGQGGFGLLSKDYGGGQGLPCA